jgi:hypothetical protein
MPEVVVAIIFGVFGWIVWVITTNIRRSKTARAVADLHAKLLDRCSNNNELLMYLESESGRRYLESATTGGSTPFTRILNAVQAGAVLLLFGIAMVVVRLALEDTDARNVLVVLGAAALSIGAGFLISAAISYTLCKSWGILKPGETLRQTS